MTSKSERYLSWRKIPITLRIPRKGEEKAHAAATLTRIQSQIAHYLFAPSKALHWPDRQHEHQGCDPPHPGLFHQAAGCRVLLRFLVYGSVQLRQRSIQTVENGQQFPSPATGPRI